MVISRLLRRANSMCQYPQKPERLEGSRKLLTQFPYPSWLDLRPAEDPFEPRNSSFNSLQSACAQYVLYHQSEWGRSFRHSAPRTKLL